MLERADLHQDEKGGKTGGRESSAHAPVWSPVKLLVLAALAFSPSLFGPFVLDDHQLIFNNPHFAEGASILSLFTEPVQTSLPGAVSNTYYRPLSFLSLWLDHAIWGDRAFGFHLTNLLFHLASTYLVYRLGRRWGGVVVGNAVAALWALQPIHAETVSYVAARHDVIFMFFYLLALDVYTGGGGIRRVGAFVVLSVVAFLGKEMAISLPVVAVLYDLLLRDADHHDRCRWREACRRCWGPALTLVTLLAVRVFVMMRSGPDVRSSEAVFWPDVELIASVAWQYVKILFTPLAYSIDRSRDIETGLVAGLALCLALGGALALLVALARRRDAATGRLVTFAVLWAVVAYLPVSNLIPLYSRCADRYLYLPILALLLALAAYLAGAVVRSPLTSTRSYRVVLVALVTMTCVRCFFFTTERTLYAVSLRSSPLSPMLHNNYGRILKAEGELTGAATQFATALHLEKGYSAARFNLGLLARECQDFETAESQFAEYVASKPEAPDGWLQWGLVALASGRADEAWHRLMEAESRKPGTLGVGYHLALAEYEIGEFESARVRLLSLRRRFLELPMTRRLLDRIEDREKGGRRGGAETGD